MSDNFSSQSSSILSTAKAVKVTVLSIHGIVAKKKKIKGGDIEVEGKETATIVASVPQANSQSTCDPAFFTHFHSLPLTLASSYKLHWLTMDGNSASDLLTIQFDRQFLGEADGTRRFVPQTCPVNLSVSRNGKTALLGRFDLSITGEENGQTPVIIPVTSAALDPKTQEQNSSVTNSLGKIRNMGKGSSSNKNISMSKISKTDPFQFGLQTGAMIRLLVNVSDINTVKEEEKHTQDEADAKAVSIEHTSTEIECSIEHEHHKDDMETESEVCSLRRQLSRAQDELSSAKESIISKEQMNTALYDENLHLRALLKLSKRGKESTIRSSDDAQMQMQDPTIDSADIQETKMESPFVARNEHEQKANAYDAVLPPSFEQRITEVLHQLKEFGI